MCACVLGERHAQMLRLSTTIMTSRNNRQEVKMRNREIVPTTEIERRRERDRERRRKIQRKEAADEETTTRLVIGRKY